MRVFLGVSGWGWISAINKIAKKQSGGGRTVGGNKVKNHLTRSPRPRPPHPRHNPASRYRHLFCFTSRITNTKLNFCRVFYLMYAVLSLKMLCITFSILWTESKARSSVWFSVQPSKRKKLLREIKVHTIIPNIIHRGYIVNIEVCSMISLISCYVLN